MYLLDIAGDLTSLGNFHIIKESCISVCAAASAPVFCPLKSGCCHLPQTQLPPYLAETLLSSACIAPPGQQPGNPQSRELSDCRAHLFLCCGSEIAAAHWLMFIVMETAVSSNSHSKSKLKLIKLYKITIHSYIHTSHISCPCLLCEARSYLTDSIGLERRRELYSFTAAQVHWADDKIFFFKINLW